MDELRTQWAVILAFEPVLVWCVLVFLELLLAPLKENGSIRFVEEEKSCGSVDCADDGQDPEDPAEA